MRDHTLSSGLESLAPQRSIVKQQLYCHTQVGFKPKYITHPCSHMCSIQLLGQQRLYKALHCRGGDSGRHGNACSICKCEVKGERVLAQNKHTTAVLLDNTAGFLAPLMPQQSPNTNKVNFAGLSHTHTSHKRLYKRLSSTMHMVKAKQSC